MLRGVRVDLETSRDTLPLLKAAYISDLEAHLEEPEGTQPDISDEVIRHVKTIVRSLRSALDSTATAIEQAHGTGQKNAPYFLMTMDQARFEELLDQQIRGLRATRPDIADAIERHQPYHPESAELQHLPSLYKVNSHRDYTLQIQGTGMTHTMSFMGMHIMSLGPTGMQIGGAAPWLGLAKTPPTVAGDPEVASGVSGEYIDWRFQDPAISVLGTLLPLHETVVRAVEDVSQVAGL